MAGRPSGQEESKVVGWTEGEDEGEGEACELPRCRRLTPMYLSRQPWSSTLVC